MLKKANSEKNTYFITEYFDLSITSMENRAIGIPWIIVSINLKMEW